MLKSELKYRIRYLHMIAYFQTSIPYCLKRENYVSKDEFSVYNLSKVIPNIKNAQKRLHKVKQKRP
jgi:hypothetical protein